MDCVGCEKCRLWGKVQISGIGAMLKILFSYDHERDVSNPSSQLKHLSLQRSEIISLINVFHQLSNSIYGIQVFRTLYNQSTEMEDNVADYSDTTVEQNESHPTLNLVVLVALMGVMMALSYFFLIPAQKYR